MRSLVVKIGSLLALSIIFASVSVQAQRLPRQYRAQIPFDFTIGNQIYQAGKCRLEIDDLYAFKAVLSVLYAQTGDWKRMAITKNHNRLWENKTVLMFERLGERYFLKELISPDFSFRAPASKEAKRPTEKNKQPPESVAIVLANGGKPIE